MKAHSKLFPKFIEYIGSGNWRIRWNVKTVLETHMEEESESYEYEELEFKYKPDIEEIKKYIVDWCYNYYKPTIFKIEDINCWYNDDSRATLKSKCEENINNEVEITSIIGENMILNLPTKVTLQALIQMNEYADSYKKVVEEFIQDIRECGTIEEINDLDFDLKFPEVVNVTSNKLRKDAITAEKESVSNQAIIFSKMIINTVELTDNQSLQVKKLYPSWEEFLNKSLKMGMKVLYNDSLFRVRVDIPIVLENQFPSVDTASLYEEINEVHSGTVDDPIPFNNNMELELGKYYTQFDVVYMCFRDSQAPVYQDLEELIDIYVKLV